MGLFSFFFFFFKCVCGGSSSLSVSKRNEEFQNQLQHGVSCYLCCLGMGTTQLGSMCDWFSVECGTRDNLLLVPVSALQRMLLRAGPVDI